MKTFRDLGVSNAILKACERLNWTAPLPIQICAIPPALKGKDIVGTSETGSGKTAAFLIPILQKWLDAGRPTGYALILAPTRELACQIAESASRIMAEVCISDYQNSDAASAPANFNVFQLIGGENSVEQAISLAWCRHNMIVATPGRLLEHMKQSPGFAQHHLSTIKQLVLDEVDRMLSMEFADDIDALLNVFEKPAALLAPGGTRERKKTYLERRMEEITPTLHLSSAGDAVKRETYHHKGARFPHPQTYIYSATMSRDVNKLRRVALNRDAVLCTAAAAPASEGQEEKEEKVGDEKRTGAEAEEVKSAKVELPAGLRHFSLPCRRSDKLAVLNWLVQCYLVQVNSNDNRENSRAIVFCARCHETRFLAGFLRECGHSVVGLTGRMKQSDRRRVLAEFTEGRVKVLVATDVASRGLDIPMVGMVINYGVPLTSKTYRHRVGRTARAGKQGTAVTLFTRDEGMSYLELEQALFPAAKGEESQSIPRWPHKLPPEQTREKSDCMSVRRRLADEAWSRASQKLRQEAALELEEKRAANDDVSFSSDEDNCLLGNDDYDNAEDDRLELANQHWASGAAGIQAAREAHARDRDTRKRRTEEGYDGEANSEEDEDDEEEKGNLNFAQPIKEKRAAISAAKKQKKALDARKDRRPRD